MTTGFIMMSDDLQFFCLECAEKVIRDSIEDEQDATSVVNYIRNRVLHRGYFDGLENCSALRLSGFKITLSNMVWEAALLENKDRLKHHLKEKHKKLYWAWLVIAGYKPKRKLTPSEEVLIACYTLYRAFCNPNVYLLGKMFGVSGDLIQDYISKAFRLICLRRDECIYKDFLAE